MELLNEEPCIGLHGQSGDVSHDLLFGSPDDMGLIHPGTKGTKQMTWECGVSMYVS